MTIEDHFENSESVVEALGSWPSFHDAEVIFLKLDRADRVLEAGIELPPTTKPGSRCQVNLRFTGIRDLDIDGFNEQNVLSELLIEQEPNELRVTFGPCYGLSGEFLCARAVVAQVIVEST